MNLQDLRTLLDYHYWARDRMFEVLEPLTREQVERDMGNSFKSIRDTVTHLYAADWVWYSRWQGVSPPLASGRIRRLKPPRLSSSLSRDRGRHPLNPASGDALASSADGQ